MSPFSISIREEFQASFPEWIIFMAEETYERSEPYLVVNVPAPTEAATNLPLRISTYDDEVTVDFDYYHTHFERWKPNEGDDKHRSAELYVRAVLDEEIAVASWWQGDLCKLCSQLIPGESLKPKFNIQFDTVRVRSWRGTHNADGGA